jgi:sec-independent protein translocase protein TatA
MSMGGPELLIVLAVVLLLFGAKKVPDLARSLGQAKREFDDGTREAPPADQAA